MPRNRQRLARAHHWGHLPLISAPVADEPGLCAGLRALGAAETRSTPLVSCTLGLRSLPCSRITWANHPTGHAANSPSMVGDVNAHPADFAWMPVHCPSASAAARCIGVRNASLGLEWPAIRKLQGTNHWRPMARLETVAGIGCTRTVAARAFASFRHLK